MNKFAPPKSQAFRVTLTGMFIAVAEDEYPFATPKEVAAQIATDPSKLCDILRSNGTITLTLVPQEDLHLDGYED